MFVVPIEVAPNENASPLNYLSSVVANTTDTIYEGQKLSWQKNRLQFNVDGLYYFDAERIFFTYRLPGPGNDTNNMSEQVLVTYTDLKDETGHATGTSVRIMIPTFV